MTLGFSHLPEISSPLGMIDTRWRLAALILATAIVAALHTLPAAALALALALILAGCACLPLRWLGARLVTLLLAMAPAVVLLPLLHRDEHALLALGPWHISMAGTQLAVLIVLKGMALGTLAIVALTSAPLATTLDAAHRLHVPGLLIQLLLLSYRHAFLIADELSRLRLALRLRGFRARVDRHGYHTVGQVVGTLLVRGHERAERVAQAMTCRGFAGRFQSLCDFRTRPVDVVAFVAILGAALAIGLWDIAAYD
jgi:cobalt/nickel transport system permease protein